MKKNYNKNYIIDVGIPVIKAKSLMTEINTRANKPQFSQRRSRNFKLGIKDER